MTASTELPTRLLGVGLLGSALLMGVLAGVNPALAIGLTVGLVLLVMMMANLTAGVCLLAFLTFLDTILPADAEGALSVSKLVGLVLVLSWFALITAGERERSQQIFSPQAFLFRADLLRGLGGRERRLGRGHGRRYRRDHPQPAERHAVPDRLRGRPHPQAAALGRGQPRRGAVVAAACGMVVGPPQDDPGRVAIGNANETAASLVTGGTLAAALAFALRGKPVLRLLTAVAVPLCVFAVFLTLSQGGLVVLGASLIAAIVLAGRRRGPLLGLAAAAVLATVVYFSASAPVEARDRVLEWEGGTGRTDIWTVG